MAQKSKHTVLLFSTVVVAVCALLWWRIDAQASSYQELVAKTASVTEGYDQEFIAMVDRLEDELAERASFPYLGKKDPMTGKTRNVVIAAPSPSSREERRRVRVKEAPAKPLTAQVLEAAPVVEAPDPVRLTAVIFDDIKRVHTAIMMVGERSFAVEVGDRIHGRRATEITVSSVTLEDQQKIYQYNISGQKSSRLK